MIVLTYLLHLRTITIIIAPKIADITETIINVKAHPSSPAASENIKIKQYCIDCVLCFGLRGDCVFCSFCAPFSPLDYGWTIFELHKGN